LKIKDASLSDKVEEIKISPDYFLINILYVAIKKVWTEVGTRKKTRKFKFMRGFDNKDF